MRSPEEKEDGRRGGGEEGGVTKVRRRNRLVTPLSGVGLESCRCVCYAAPSGVRLWKRDHGDSGHRAVQMM